MEDLALTTSSNNRDHAANPFNVAQSARNLATSVRTVEGTSAQDVKNGDLAIRPPTAPSGWKGCGKRVKSGPR